MLFCKKAAGLLKMSFCDLISVRKGFLYDNAVFELLTLNKIYTYFRRVMFLYLIYGKIYCEFRDWLHCASKGNIKTDHMSYFVCL